MREEHIYQNQEIKLKYYEIKNELQPLVLIHAQGVDSTSFEPVWQQLSKKYHVYAVDCYGHGESLHDPDRYNIVDIGKAISRFIEEEIKEQVFLLGHSSGGLIAAYIASTTELCKYLILEDPPFFASQGERRKSTCNYVDLSTICDNFIHQSKETDFVLYCFTNQYMWNFFPEESREKIRKKMIGMATKYRKKHPDRNLKLMFWPKSALSAYCGMNRYDPYFGETFFDDSFHCGIPHEDLLKNIRCKTIFQKAQTNISEDGILLAALSEEDLQKVTELIPDCQVERFDCGHGIHVERSQQFVHCLMQLM